MLLHSCTVCKLFFSLKSPSPTLERNMDLPNLIWIINLTRATLLAMAKCIYHIFGKSILGDPEAVSWVSKNGGESFQERERGPLGILLTTSFATYSNVCLWFGTHTHKNDFVPYKRPASIALLSRSSYIRKFNRKLNCSPYMFRCCRRAFFSENARNPQDQRNCVILRFQKKNHGSEA